MLQVFGKRPPKSDFEEAERRYVLGKMSNNKNIVCSSIDYYEAALKNVSEKEDILIILENILIFFRI